jgi:hypothetical protein
MSTRPLYHRARPALRAKVDAAGPGALPALVLLGLAAAGYTVEDLETEYHQAIAGDVAPPVKQALRSLFSGPDPASSVQAERLRPASTAAEGPLMTVEQLDQLPEGEDDPLAGIGFEV